MTRRAVSGTKDNDLGKGGAGLPGLLSKFNRLDILAIKWNSSGDILADRSNDARRSFAPVLLILLKANTSGPTDKANVVDLASIAIAVAGKPP